MNDIRLTPGQIRKLEKALRDGNLYEKKGNGFVQLGLDSLPKPLISYEVDSKLKDDQIDIIMKHDYTPAQRRAIADGFLVSKLNYAAVEVYARPDFSATVMNHMRNGFKDGLSYEVAALIQPEYSADQVCAIILAHKKGASKETISKYLKLGYKYNDLIHACEMVAKKANPDVISLFEKCKNTTHRSIIYEYKDIDPNIISVILKTNIPNDYKRHILFKIRNKTFTFSKEKIDALKKYIKENPVQYQYWDEIDCIFS